MMRNMPSALCGRPLSRRGWLLSTACFFISSTAARADSVNTQTRNFHISVDGARCGTFRLTIATHPDGRDVVEGDAALELKYFLYTFRYASKGVETWLAGRLQHLDNEARYGGSKYEVSARRLGQDLVVQTNGTQRRVRGDVWVTSYWREPAAALVGQNVALLDADKGRTLTGKLERLGNEPIPMGGQNQPCTHYRLKGEVEVDLWYDAESRLVRQHSIESGHKTQIELADIAQ
jgi:hypothetical protein